MYGRENELAKLNDIRNDHTKPKSARLQADKAHATIVRQLKDSRLMNMRERLMRAAQAGDRAEMARIAAAMKDYEGSDRETGHYGI